jgi:hypothetical protein
MTTGIEIKYNKDGFPQEINVPEHGAIPKHSVNVSAGGIVRTPYLEDALLLKEDGVTAVIYERNLKDEFYKAAQATTQDTIDKLLEIRRLKIELFKSDKPNNLEQNISNILQEQNNPLLEQAAKDSDVVLPYFVEVFNSVSKGHKRTTRHIKEGYHTNNLTMTRLGFHCDGINFVIRALSYYAGKTTTLLDGRISEEEYKALTSTLEENRAMTEILLEHYPTTKPKVGDVLFINAAGSLQSNSFENSIRNLSVHLAPDVSPNIPRFASVCG